MTGKTTLPPVEAAAVDVVVIVTVALAALALAAEADMMEESTDAAPVKVLWIYDAAVVVGCGHSYPSCTALSAKCTSKKPAPYIADFKKQLAP